MRGRGGRQLHGRVTFGSRSQHVVDSLAINDVGVGARAWASGSRCRMASCYGDQCFKVRVAGNGGRGSGFQAHGQKFIRLVQEGPIQDIRSTTCFQVFNMPIDLVLR